MKQFIFCAKQNIELALISFDRTQLYEKKEHEEKDGNQCVTPSNTSDIAWLDEDLRRWQ